LLGRFGDIFKMGPLFNYNDFKKILEEKFDYSYELQLVLDTAEANKQKITMRINKLSGIIPEQACKVILEHFHDLSEMVVKDDLIELIAEVIDGKDFTKIKSSGKLHKIIDNRKLTL